MLIPILFHEVIINKCIVIGFISRGGWVCNRTRSGTSVNASQARNRNRSGQFLQVWTQHERVERDRNANRNRCEHSLRI